MIKIINDEVYLSDLNSKFGTLVLIKKPIEVKPWENLKLQFGRTAINFGLESVVCSCTKE